MGGLSLIRFYIPFNSISVILGWKGENERLSAMKGHIVLIFLISSEKLSFVTNVLDIT